MAINIGTQYQFSDSDNTANDPELSQFFIDPRSGISSTFAALTDEQCAAIVAAGNTCFSMVTTPGVTLNSAVDAGTGQTNYNFTITAGTGTNAFMIQFSVDGGTTWAEFASGNNIANGVHAPELPNATTGAVKVRFGLTVSGTTYYSSAISLTWTEPSTEITISTPTADGSGGYNYPVTISNGGGSNAVSVSYSTDSGATWTVLCLTTNMADGTASVGDEPVPPAESGRTVLLRAKMAPAGGGITAYSSQISFTF